MNRRTFLQSTGTAALQSTSAAALLPLSAQEKSPWGGPVLDIHLHPRRSPNTCFQHMEGSGVTHGVILARVSDEDRVQAEIKSHPGKIIWFASTDPSQAGAVELLRKAVAKGGARGFGELKNHLAADSAAMRRVYDLAAELRVPVLVHFQEVEHFKGEGDWNTGYREFDKVLRAHPKTTFIGHADFFWANISAELPAGVAYPEGRVKKGGLTDKWLADFPNLYADMSANSGYNALTRDAEFTRAFVNRHQSKLMFGCDCSCQDGNGTGGSPILPALKGKCVARATLGALKGMTTAEVFRKVTYANGVKLLGI